MNKIEPQATALFNARFDQLLREITNIKSECNARGLLVNDNIQSELLDSFANSETSKMRQSLASGGLLEPERLTNVANLAKLNAQANLRKYYQDQLKKKWYKLLNPLAALIRLIGLS